MANAAQRFFGWDVAMTLGFLALTNYHSIQNKGALACFLYCTEQNCEKGIGGDFSPFILPTRQIL